MSVQKRIIGRVPIHVGDWSSSVTYQRKQRVSRYGCEFESKIDNNKNHAPATLVGNTSITFDTTNWYITSNGSAAYLADARMNDMQDQINNIVGKDVVVSVSPSVVYKHEATSVTVRGDASNISGVTGMFVAQGGSTIKTVTTNTISASTTVNDSANVTFIVGTTIGGSTTTKNVTVTVVDKIYYGAATAYTGASTYDASARTSPAGTYTITVGSNGLYVFFNVPNSMSIKTAKMNGFDFPLGKPTTVTIDGVSYKSYKSVNTYQKGTLKIVLT